MKKFSLFFVSFILFSVANSQVRKDTLTNDKIVNMVKNGITDLLIKKSITTASNWIFDLSSDGLINLKKNKVNDSIIVTMFDKESPITKSANNTTVISPEPNKLNESQSSETSIENLNPGIYYLSIVKNKSEYVRLNSVTPAGGFRQDPVLGISMKTEYTFIGKKALLQIKSPSPEFYIKLGNGYDNILYQPTQFIVLHATPKKGNRIVSGKSGVGIGITRNMAQFDPKSIITPVYTRLNDNLYKVTFEKKLPDGNYFFAPTTSSKGKDFLEFDID